MVVCSNREQVCPPLPTHIPGSAETLDPTPVAADRLSTVACILTIAIAEPKVLVRAGHLWKPGFRSLKPTLWDVLGRAW